MPDAAKDSSTCLVENEFRRHAAVAAGQHHGFGRLPAAQPLPQLLIWVHASLLLALQGGASRRDGAAMSAAEGMQAAGGLDLPERTFP